MGISYIEESAAIELHKLSTAAACVGGGGGGKSHISQYIGTNKSDACKIFCAYRAAGGGGA